MCRVVDHAWAEPAGDSKIKCRRCALLPAGEVYICWATVPIRVSGSTVLKGCSHEGPRLQQALAFELRVESRAPAEEEHLIPK